MRKRILNFVKKETVLIIAAILAAVSAFLVPPSAAYLDYIDWRVLGILLALMTVMAGLQKNGIFDRIGIWLLQRTKNTVQLTGVLVFLCFFSGMLITNDVALITFVPFAVFTLQKCSQERLMVLVIVLQTIAANLGSMLTPIGNPQNLYLYNLSGMELAAFLRLMLPYTCAAGALLLLVILILGARKQRISLAFEEDARAEVQDGKPQGWLTSGRKSVVYLILFGLCLLVVARILPYYIVLALVLVVTAVMERDVLKKVDYSLLLTFICFFIFTGNMGRLDAVYDFLQNIVAGRELMSGILVSQVISNVPAALLLSGFTEDYSALLLGVNLGGLGTLIASMASLISYKIYARNYNRTKGSYLIYFTVANLCFLAVLLVLARFI